MYPKARREAYAVTRTSQDAASLALRYGGVALGDGGMESCPWVPSKSAACEPTSWSEQMGLLDKLTRPGPQRQ